MGRIPINGVHLNAEVTGAGPAILAIHGFTGSTATWELFSSAAGRDYTVIAVDMLGHGASDAPSNPERYGMEQCIEDLGEILDRLGVQQVHWLGYSMGGRIALSAAINLPHRTSNLILESASPGLANPEERAARVREDEELADWIEEVGVERFLDRWEALPLFASQARLPQVTREKLRAQRLRNTPLGLANSLRGIGTGAQPPLHHRIKTLQAPTLFLAGEEDTKFLALAQDMRNAVSQSRLSTIPNVGHAAHLEQPDLFNQTILEFLASHQQEIVPSARM